jgi:hypothetical protein
MANPTSNFNWQMPTNTDLVKDLPADFEVFGQAVDTSLADLKGGTSGQILSKNSNTDMDFVWINNDQGDITAVNVTSPITGGGSAGAVTVGIQDGTTAQKGAVQLENSTSSTSTTTAAVPASVKSAYDLANAAIPKSLVDAAGDLIYATANDTVARLAIGTAGQVLKVNSGATAPEWGAAPAGKVLQVVQVTTTTTVTSSTNTQVSTGMTASITPASTANKILVLASTTFQKSSGNAASRIQVQVKRGATQIALSENVTYNNTAVETISPWALTYLDSPSTTSSTTYDITFANAANVASVQAQYSSSTGSIILMEIGA